MDICEIFLINIRVKLLHFLSSIQPSYRPELYITQPTNSENWGEGFLHKILHPSIKLNAIKS